MCVLFPGRGSLRGAKAMVLCEMAEADTGVKLPAGGGADGKPLALLLGHEHPLARMVETSYAVGTEVHDVALELREDAAISRFLVSIFSLGRGPGPSEKIDRKSTRLNSSHT